MHRRSERSDSDSKQQNLGGFQVFYDGCRDCVPAEGYKGREAPWQGLGQSPDILRV